MLATTTKAEPEVSPNDLSICSKKVNANIIADEKPRITVVLVDIKGLETWSKAKSTTHIEKFDEKISESVFSSEIINVPCCLPV